MPRIITAVLIATIAAGCSSPAAPAGPADINGSWQFVGSISNPSIDASCELSGTVTTTQAGESFSGSGLGTLICTVAGSSDSQYGAWQLTGGTVKRNAVSFYGMDGCLYTGTASGEPVNRMAGSTSCTLAISGTDYPFTGHWSASR